jgi:hypothetical protein
MTLIFVGSLGNALGVRLGILIGQSDIEGGKQTVRVGGGICCGVLAFLSLVLYVMVRPIGSMFSDDPAIIEQFFQTRLPLAAMVFSMNLSVFLERILVAFGRTKVVFYAGVVGSWIGQVPSVMLALHFWRNDLVGLYWGVSFGYTLLCLLLISFIQRVNWQDIISEGQQRAFSPKKKSVEPPCPGPGTCASRKSLWGFKSSSKSLLGLKSSSLCPHKYLEQEELDLKPNTERGGDHSSEEDGKAKDEYREQSTLGSKKAKTDRVSKGKDFPLSDIERGDFPKYEDFDTYPPNGNSLSEGRDQGGGEGAGESAHALTSMLSAPEYEIDSKVEKMQLNKDLEILVRVASGHAR